MPSRTETHRPAETQTVDERLEQLARLRENPRVESIIVMVSHDSCLACLEIQGTYDKDSVPELPVAVCSHPLGCRSSYIPVYKELFP